MACKSWRYEVFENRSKKFLQKSLMPVFMFLRICEDFSYKSSSMKSVWTAAIMFVSVARHHSTKHLHKCAQLLRFSISLKLALNVCLSKVVPRTLGLALKFLKRLQGIQFGMTKSRPWSLPSLGTTQQNICSNVHKYYPSRWAGTSKHLNVCLRKVVTRTLERFLNLRCPAVTDLLRFRFFIQIRSQSVARVMWSLRCRFGRKLPQHPVVLIWKKFLLKIKFSKL